MNNVLKNKRQTKYCRSIECQLEKLGHATNAELLASLRESFPELSATTVHRATARLASRGKIATAPPDNDGSMRYEFNTTPHDHFQCSTCGQIKDVDIKDKIIPILESCIKDCNISGQLIINGTCKKCMPIKGE